MICKVKACSFFFFKTSFTSYLFTHVYNSVIGLGRYYYFLIREELTVAVVSLMLLYLDLYVQRQYVDCCYIMLWYSDWSSRTFCLSTSWLILPWYAIFCSAIYIFIRNKKVAKKRGFQALNTFDLFTIFQISNSIKKIIIFSRAVFNNLTRFP